MRIGERGGTAAIDFCVLDEQLIPASDRALTFIATAIP